MDSGSAAGEDAKGHGFEWRLKLGVVFEEVVSFKFEEFHGTLGAFVAFVEVLEVFVIVVLREEFFAFDAEGFGDAQRFSRDFAVEGEEFIEFSGWEKVVVADDLSAFDGFGVVECEGGFFFGIAAAINAADALHKADGVPVEVVVDEACGILKVEAFGEDIGADEDADFILSGGDQLGGVGLVVIGGEAAND